MKSAKQNKAIILTTHNMEEAEVLCDRLGIFVDGKLQVIGNPKNLTARYGGYLVTPNDTNILQFLLFVFELGVYIDYNTCECDVSCEASEDCFP